MEQGMQIVLPVIGIVAAAAVTFYAVSFSELSEKSFRDLDEKEAAEKGRFPLSMSSKERRALRQAQKNSKSNSKT